MKPAQIFSHWQQVHTDTLATFDKFNNDELAYTPFPSSWPAGELMLHIADTEEGWLRFVVQRKLAEWPSQYTLQNYPTVANIQAALIEAHQQTVEYLDMLEEADLERIIITPRGRQRTLSWILWHVLEHEIHHRGELSLILGVLGREGLDV